MGGRVVFALVLGGLIAFSMVIHAGQEGSSSEGVVGDVGGETVAENEPERVLPDEQIQQRIHEGAGLFREGKYLDALAIFEDVYRITREPRLLFLMGRCQQELGRPRGALESFTLFLKADIPIENRVRAEEAKAAVQAQLKGWLALDVSPKGSEVWVAGALVGSAPVPSMELESGSYDILVRKQGMIDDRRTVEVRIMGVEERVRITLTPVPTVVSPVDHVEEEDPIPVRDRLLPHMPEGWEYWALGGGSAMALGGTIALIVGVVDHNKVTSTSGYGTSGVTQMTRVHAMELDRKGRTKKITGAVFLSMGAAVLAGTGGVLGYEWYLEYQKEQQLYRDEIMVEPREDSAPQGAPSVGLTFAPLPRGGFLSLRGSF